VASSDIAAVALEVPAELEARSWFGSFALLRATVQRASVRERDSRLRAQVKCFSFNQKQGNDRHGQPP